jgi:hypothetical protein
MALTIGSSEAKMQEKISNKNQFIQSITKKIFAELIDRVTDYLLG